MSRKLQYLSLLAVFLLLGTLGVITNAQGVSIQVNFQTEATNPPAGYIEDYGQPYGLRTGPQQGSGLTYGWVESATDNPVDLTVSPSDGASRNRGTSQSDLRLDTLMHMDHPSGIESYWEIAIPNGEYEVTVSVGDPAVQGSDSEDFHTVNVEGVNVINNFQSTGGDGSADRHTDGTAIVTVNDGVLTVDQDGGTNTKINYIDIVSTGDALLFDRSTVDLTVPIDSIASTQVVLSSTTGSPNYTIDTSGAPSWLTSVTTPQPTSTGGVNVTIEVNTTGESVGTQLSHTLIATATDYSSAEIDVIVDVISDRIQVNPSDTTPLANAINVDVNTSVTANFLNTSGGGLDSNLTVTEAMFTLYPTGNPSASVAANRNTTGGGDSISLVPLAPLAEQTQYTVEVTDQLIDINGKPAIPYTWTFTTGLASGGTIDDVEFEKVNLSDDGNGFWSQLAIGPDGRLYAATIGSGISRWDIAADGTLNSRVDLNIPELNGQAMVGLIFDPQSTAENPVIYATSNLGNLSDSANFSGKLVRLTETDTGLTNESWVYTELVTSLPRSKKDHLSNSLVFGLYGERALYMTQGSISAMGAPDGAWGNRYETVLSSAVLRFDIDGLNNYVDTNSNPYDVRTDSNTSETAPRLGFGDPGLLYNPQAPGALVTVFATGVRNAYDLVWHSNENMYIPTNGSAGGGNSPGTPATLPVACQNRIDDAVNGNYTGPTVPAVNSHPTQRDYLFRVPFEGGTYHGHPNPTRCEWVLNGGNPTSSFDEGEPIGGAKYTVGVDPDRNYAGFAYDFENNKSPNGVIEYKSNTFGGALKGAIIVTRYSQRDDLITLFPDGPDGDIGTDYDGNEIPGFSGFNNPLDLTEDLRNGNIYVADSNGITLLRPVGSAGNPTPDIVLTGNELIFDQVTSAGASDPKSVTISNIGTANLTFSATTSGANDDQFNAPAGIFTLTPGQSTTVDVTFDPTSNGPKFATLVLDTNDPDEDPVTIALAGLGKAGTGGTNEPSLQWILDTFQFGINVGDTNNATNLIDLPGGSTYNDLLGDEVDAQLFERAVDAPVTLELLAVYGPTGSNPVVEVGYYTEGNGGSPIPLFDVDNTPTSNGQSLLPPINSGTLSFDPGLDKFGFYSEWPAFGNRQLFQDDTLNTFSGNIPHHVRIYELPGEDDAYIVATEEHISGFDYQDVVFIARNVRPANETPSDGGIIRFENLDWVNFPFSDYPQMEYLNTWLTMSRINSFQQHKFHDDAILRINNDSTEDELTITGLAISDTSEFTFPNNDTSSLPIVIQPGQFYDLEVQFVESSGGKGIRQRTLTITSTDPTNGVAVINLAGGYMSQPEGGSEITADDVADAFGFEPDSQGRNLIPLSSEYVARYDEVLSFRWKRADPSKPIYGRQLAAFHGCYDSVGFSMSGGGSMSHNGNYCQSLLPSNINSDDAINNRVENNFTPNNIFTISAAGYNTNRCEGITDCLGHGMRLWPVFVDGQLVPNTYYAIQDYVGSAGGTGCGAGSANCDFNDNMYLLTNLEPENTTFDLAVTDVTESDDPVAIGDEILYTFEISNPGLFSSEPGTFTFDVTGVGSLVSAFLGDTPPDDEPSGPTVGPIYRINAGGPAVTTPSGDWIESDFFTGGRSSGSAQAIANTTDDVVYQTEWSTSGGGFTFSAPVDNGDYTVRLHLAETYFTGVGSNPAPGAGNRTFDVTLEGNLILDSYDVFVEAGGALSADIQEFNVTISDGNVSLEFIDNGANNPTVSGIEIIGETTGGGGPTDCTNGVCTIPAVDGGSTLLVSALVSADSAGTVTTTGTVASTGDTDTGNDGLTEETLVFDPSNLPGNITIIKDAVPDSAQEFAFTGDLGEFTLSDTGTSGGTGEILQFNFQLEGVPVPAGYLPDVGEPYGPQPTGYTHGWFDLATDQPIDATGANGALRDRDRSGIPQELDTLVHFARADAVESGGFLDDIYWELELPNGDYRVTVSVGDQGSGSNGYDSQHQIRVEGVNVFPSPQQLDANNEYITGTVDVTVNDGRLTVDEGNGFNSKANYIIIESLAEPNTITFEDQIPATYEIEETDVAGWSLVNAVCDDDNSSYNASTGILSIVLDGDEDLTCTFTNAEEGIPTVEIEPAELVFSALELTTSPSQTITVTNTGTGVLEITGASIVGSDFGQTSAPINLLAGESTNVDVTFTPPDIVADPDPRAFTAQLEIVTTSGNASVDLYGVANSAYGGSGEPPLADVVSTLGYGFDVGWTQLTNNASSPATAPVAVGDEVLEPLFQKAGSGNVTMLPVARYSPSEELPYGFYVPDGSSTPPTTQVGALQTGTAEAQQLFPPIVSGGTTFDPGSDGFGIYVFSNSFGRTNYTEDSLNTGGVAHRARVYPMADRAGNPIANSYLVAFEDASNGDYQDYVFVLTNVEPYDPVQVVECNPISTLDCSQVPVTLPYTLDWTNDEGGLDDNGGTGTGFTMVDPPSARIAADDPVSNPNVPGYEPGQLAVDTNAGTLTITSNKGIQFSQPSGTPTSTDTNSLINGLGVGIDAATNVVNIETTLVNPDFSSSAGAANFQQAGLWYGLSEDQYVKLVVIREGADDGRVQLFFEDVVNNTTTATAFLELNGANIQNLSTQTIDLRMSIDPTLGLVAGFYSLDGGTTEIQLENNAITLPGFMTAGVDHDNDGGTDNIAYAGIFATHRRSTTSFPATFSNFSVTYPNVAPDTIVDGMVLLEGHSDHSGTYAVAVYATGSDSVAFPSITTAIVDSAGNFELTGLTPGTYDIALKHPQYLQVLETVTLSEGGNNIDFGILLAGDVDNNNLVNLPDFSLLGTAFGTTSGDQDYNELADFTGDDIVNLADFSLLAGNFATAGEEPGLAP